MIIWQDNSFKVYNRAISERRTYLEVHTVGLHKAYEWWILLIGYVMMFALLRHSVGGGCRVQVSTRWHYEGVPSGEARAG